MIPFFVELEFLVPFVFRFFRKILFFEASCLSPHWTSQRTAPLNGLPLSKDCASQWTGPLGGLPLSLNCTCEVFSPHWTFNGLDLSLDCPSQWTAPLNGLDLSKDCASQWTVPVVDCRTSWLSFSWKNFGLLDFLSRFERCSATNEKPDLAGW